jgi:hypothetical protein
VLLKRDSTLVALGGDEQEVKPTPKNCVMRREKFADNGDDISFYDMDAKIEDEIARQDNLTMETTAAATITIKNKEGSPFNVGSRKVVNFGKARM